jgi:hypothetical protein
LLTGRLAASADGGADIANESGQHRLVIWPDGYAVDHTPDLVLRDQFGMTVAVEGDTIYVGGGEDGQDGDKPAAFRACGYVSRDPPH